MSSCSLVCFWVFSHSLVHSLFFFPLKVAAPWPLFISKDAKVKGITVKSKVQCFTRVRSRQPFLLEPTFVIVCTALLWFDKKCSTAYSRTSARDAVSVLCSCVLVDKLVSVIYASRALEHVAVVALYLICGTKLHLLFGAKSYLLCDFAPSSSQTLRHLYVHLTKEPKE